MPICVLWRTNGQRTTSTKRHDGGTLIARRQPVSKPDQGLVTVRRVVDSNNGRLKLHATRALGTLLLRFAWLCSALLCFKQPGKGETNNNWSTGRASTVAMKYRVRIATVH
ncbi:hypothetical protein F4825DRAFT_339638 [Nemania diffusa]|nr:hypothetical protein F4825DRAFT_339638 [Nemania diffusa]